MMGFNVEAPPEWAIRRDISLVKKNMDRHAQVPSSELSHRDQQVMQGIWIAYNHTLGDSTRSYISDQIIADITRHAKGRQSLQEQVYVDIGAGNGRITSKVITSLSPVTRLRGYLVEQSGPALDAARQHLTSDANLRPDIAGGRLHLTFLQKDVTNTSIPDKSADLLTVVNVFHHLTYKDLLAAAGEIDRILKTGGRFVIVDTHRLPEKGFRRWMVFKAITRAVNADRMIKQAAKSGIRYSDEEKEGMRQFTEHDAFTAFDNAMTQAEFAELLGNSALAPSLQSVRELRSPHLLRRHIYPILNYATGVKK